MFLLLLTVLYIYLQITISYNGNSVEEECVRMIPEHQKTAEAILIGFFYFSVITIPC